jgi:predicted amidophosphoribosyltransferase
LARHLAGRAGRQLEARALARVRATTPQVAQNREQRLANVAGAFAVRNPERLRGRPVVLVDDVVTTGATALACVRALRTRGANVCAVIAIARAGDSLKNL